MGLPPPESSSMGGPSHTRHGPPPFPRTGTRQGLTFVEVDGAHVLVDCKSRGVQCADAGLKARVERAIARLEAAMHACPLEG